MGVIAPSILAADFSQLGDQVQQTIAGGADRIHIDVMDGHFVRNLSMGSVVVKGLRPMTTVPLEVHLMVEDPNIFIDGFIHAGCNTIIFHLEVHPEPLELIRHLRALGQKVGVAFNPDYDINRVENYLADIDLALCMTVFPGFGGQAYIPKSNTRIQRLRQLIDRTNPKCELEVDGGIDTRTIAQAAQAGADVFVAGTSIFKSKEGIQAATEKLRQLVS